MLRASIWFVALIGLTLTATVAPIHAGTAAPSEKEVKKALNRAYGYLKKAQNADGSFAPKVAGPGVSAIVAAGLLRNGYSPKDPLVAATMKYLQSQVQNDGGIYNRFLANYTTSVAVMAFKEANDGRYDKLLKNAAAFLKKIQHDEPQSLTSDAKFGGFGYDKGSRPDASNSIFSVEALLAAGVAKDDPAIKKAMKFLSRCQNLPGEQNDQAFAKKTTKDDRGGLTYTPFVTDKNQYKTASGGLRSLGSMTYGGLKSFLYAGVSKDDPRVKAAVEWIRRHYTLKENPGLGSAGLYYYYHTFAKAMDALDEEQFADAKGKNHAWRAELFNELSARQQADGSWLNKGDRRFGESVPELATAFAILSMSYCQDGKK